jgi:putative hydrolase of the HAD superfamily
MDTKEMNENPEALIFDLDDTLMVEKASAIAAFRESSRPVEKDYGIAAETLGEAARQCCRELWHQSPARQYCLDTHIGSREALWAEFTGDDPNLKILREWAPYYRQQSWNNALLVCGINNTALAASLAETFVCNRRKRQFLFPDAQTCLDELSKEFSLALLTNGMSELQRKKINAVGIGRYFKEIIIAGEIGFGKPDIRIFQLTLSRLNLRPEQVWMVGDNLKRDLQGAQALGMKTVWLNRDGKPGDEDIIPDMAITNLAQLAEIIHQS